MEQLPSHSRVLNDPRPRGRKNLWIEPQRRQEREETRLNEARAWGPSLLQKILAPFASLRFSFGHPRGIHDAHVKYGYTLKEIADHLRIHYTTVSKVVSKGGWGKN